MPGTRDPLPTRFVTLCRRPYDLIRSRTRRVCGRVIPIRLMSARILHVGKTVSSGKRT